MTNNFYTELKDHVIQITGEKADKFIHGQFTNSITTLHEGWGNYNLFLTLKGKIRADLFVYNWNQNIYLLVNPNFTSEIVEHLKKLAPLSKCEIVDLFASNHLIHVMGKTIDEISHLKLNQVVQINLNQIKILAFRTDRWGQYGVDLMIHPKDVQIIKDFLIAKNIQNADFSLLELERIKHRIAKIGVDATDAHLPQEAFLNHALNFEKGCYLGQEVIARLQHRGHINKILTHLISKDEGIKAGDKIQSEGLDCGVVTSVAIDKNINESHVLAYIPAKMDKPGTEFVSQGRLLKVAA